MEWESNGEYARKTEEEREALGGREGRDPFSLFFINYYNISVSSSETLYKIVCKMGLLAAQLICSGPKPVGYNKSILVWIRTLGILCEFDMSQPAHCCYLLS